MSSIVLQPGVKDMLLADCKDFLASEEWYAERGTSAFLYFLPTYSLNKPVQVFPSGEVSCAVGHSTAFMLICFL